MELLTRTEELLLLSVWRLQEEAYGLAIRRQLAALLEKKVSVGAVYIPLERLAKKGYLRTWESAPTEKRGGRRKKFYKLTAKGMQALNAVKRLHEQAWHGLPNLTPGI